MLYCNWNIFQNHISPRVLSLLPYYVGGTSMAHQNSFRFLPSDRQIEIGEFRHLFEEI